MQEKLPPQDPQPTGVDVPFEALLEPHLPMLWQKAYGFTGHRQDAEDLLQELLARLYPQRDKLVSVEDLRPWLLRSLYNLFVDRRRNWLRNVLSRSDSGADDTRWETIPSEAPGPEEATAADSTQRAIFKALATLDPDQRAVVVLHDMQGHTLAELQGQLDVPIGTLKSRLFRGRRNLRPLLGNLLPGSGVLMDKETQNDL